VFAGVVDMVAALYKSIDGLVPFEAPQVNKLQVGAHDRILVEAVLALNSPLAGQTVKQCHFRTRFNAAIIAVHRHGQHVRQRIGDVVLTPGDVLLMEAHRSFVRDYRDDASFSLISESKVGTLRVGRLPYAKMAIALVALVGFIILAAVQELDVFLLVLLVALTYIFTGIITVRQAYDSIQLRVITLMAASLALSVALQNTGGAAAIANTIVNVLGRFGSMGIITALYVSCVSLTSIINPTPVIALMFPIAYNLFQKQVLTYKQAFITLILGSSAVYSTPFGYQVNLMVYHVGGYKFLDFLLIGFPLQFLVGTISIAIIYFAF